MGKQDGLGFLQRYLSRKLIFSMFSVIMIVWSVANAKKSELESSVLMTTLPCLIICITIICVSFVTGLAKIDIAASASYGKKDG